MCSFCGIIRVQRNAGPASVGTGSLPTGVEREVIHIAVSYNLSVHAVLSKHAVNVITPPLRLGFIGRLTVHRKNIESVLALGAVNQIFLLQRTAQIFLIGVNGVGFVLAFEVVNVDGDGLCVSL